MIDNIQIEGPTVHAREACDSILRSLPQWFGIESAIVDYVLDTERLPTFVLRLDGEVVAFLTLKEHFSHSWEVHCIAVAASRRNRGLGRALLTHAEGWASTQGAKWLQVKTLSSSHPSPEYAETRAFYERMGFEPFQELPTLWDEANPCLLMIKVAGQQVPKARSPGPGMTNAEAFYGTQRHQALLAAVTAYYLDDPRICAVGLFGSLTRGDWDEFSDVDLDVVVSDSVDLDPAEELRRLCERLEGIGEAAVSIVADGPDAGDVVFESLLQMSIRYHPLSATNPKILDSLRLLDTSIEVSELKAAGAANALPKRSPQSLVDQAMRFALEADVCLQRKHLWEAIESLNRLRSTIIEAFCVARGGQRAVPFFRRNASTELQGRLAEALPLSDSTSIRKALEKCVVLLADQSRELTAGQATLTPGHIAVLNGIRDRQRRLADG